MSEEATLQSAFGYIPPWLPERIGVVAIVAALVESRLDDLLMGLSGELQDRYAGESLGSHLRETRHRLKAIQREFPEFVEECTDLLDDIEQTLRQRNDVVHTIWSACSQDTAKGWRHIPFNQRVPPVPGSQSPWIKWTTMTKDEFHELVAVLDTLVDRLGHHVAKSGQVSQYLAEQRYELARRSRR
jgi:hypothetical protein